LNLILKQLKKCIKLFKNKPFKIINWFLIEEVCKIVNAVLINLDPNIRTSSNDTILKDLTTIFFSF